MTTVLPTPLSCLTLSHIINDVDAVEGYLSQDPRAANCFPLILRDLFFNNERNTKWRLKLLGIPGAATTLKYLRVLWSFTNDPFLNVIVASTAGATYMLPWLIPNGLPVKSGDWRGLPINGFAVAAPAAGSDLQRTLTFSLIAAARNGHLSTVQLLHDMGAESGYHRPGTRTQNIPFSPQGDDVFRDMAASNNIPMILLLLELEPTRADAKTRIIRDSLVNAADANNMPMLDALINTYPKHFTRDTYNYLCARIRSRIVNEKSSQEVLEWLRKYAEPRIHYS